MGGALSLNGSVRANIFGNKFIENRAVIKEKIDFSGVAGSILYNCTKEVNCWLNIYKNTITKQQNIIYKNPTLTE